MKWIYKNIKIISLIWWLLQGIILLLNNIRVYFEHRNHFVDSLFIISICLIFVSFLLWLIKNKKIVLSIGILLLLYSVVSLVFLGLLFVMESHGNNWLGLFLLIPVLNILLSIFVILSALKIKIKE